MLSQIYIEKYYWRNSTYPSSYIKKIEVWVLEFDQNWKITLFNIQKRIKWDSHSDILIWTKNISNSNQLCPTVYDQNVLKWPALKKGDNYKTVGVGEKTENRFWFSECTLVKINLCHPKNLKFVQIWWTVLFTM